MNISARHRIAAIHAVGVSSFVLSASTQALAQAPTTAPGEVICCNNLPAHAKRLIDLLHLICGERVKEPGIAKKLNALVDDFTMRLSKTPVSTAPCKQSKDPGDDVLTYFDNTQVAAPTACVMVRDVWAAQVAEFQAADAICNHPSAPSEPCCSNCGCSASVTVTPPTTTVVAVAPSNSLRFDLQPEPQVPSNSPAGLSALRITRPGVPQLFSGSAPLVFNGTLVGGGFGVAISPFAIQHATRLATEAPKRGSQGFRPLLEEDSSCGKQILRSLTISLSGASLPPSQTNPLESARQFTVAASADYATDDIIDDKDLRDCFARRTEQLAKGDLAERRAALNEPCGKERRFAMGLGAYAPFRTEVNNRLLTDGFGVWLTLEARYKFAAFTIMGQGAGTYAPNIPMTPSGVAGLRSTIGLGVGSLSAELLGGCYVTQIQTDLQRAQECERGMEAGLQGAVSLPLGITLNVGGQARCVDGEPCEGRVIGGLGWLVKPNVMKAAIAAAGLEAKE